MGPGAQVLHRHVGQSLAFVQDDWGRWADALAVRLGDGRLQPQALQPERSWVHEIEDPDRAADRLLLAAWLGQTPAGWLPELVQSLIERLHALGQPWKTDLVLQACGHLSLYRAAAPRHRLSAGDRRLDRGAHHRAAARGAAVVRAAARRRYRSGTSTPTVSSRRRSIWGSGLTSTSVPSAVGRSEATTR